MLSATIGFIVNRPLNFIDPSGNLQYFLLENFPVFFGPSSQWLDGLHMMTKMVFQSLKEL
jgi:hypothetical protein